MKKLIAIALAVMSLCLLLAGCQNPETPNETDPPAPTDAVDAILDAAFALAENATMENVTLTGKITQISEAYSEQYENITVVIAVKDRELKCYRMKGAGADTLAVDDVITVTGTIKNYYGTIEFDQGCTFTIDEKGGNAAPTIPNGYAATISFADKANRTEQTTEVQIWAQNGITVTNNKAASTSNVADYGNPARFYKSSSLKIEYTGMKKIVFELDLSQKDESGLTNATLPAGATIDANGYVVTITLSSAANSFEIEALANQIRVKNIYIYN